MNHLNKAVHIKLIINVSNFYFEKKQLRDDVCNFFLNKLTYNFDPHFIYPLILKFRILVPFKSFL